jgi:HlyD family secretion protein
MANGHSARRRIIPVIIIVVLIVAVAGGVWWYTTQRQTQPSNTVSGTVEATEYQVASAIAGRVETVTVTEGDTTKEGDVIARLDTSAFDLQVKQAQDGVKAAEAAVSQAKDTGTKADVRAAQARLDQAKAAVSLAKVQLAYATVAAPHAGTIVSVTTNAGENASPGKTLATISDPNDLFVRVFIPETEIGNVEVGQKAGITTDSTSRTYDGRVDFIASSAQFTPNNVETKDQRVKLVYEARVRISDRTGELKAGMPVDVTFE